MATDPQLFAEAIGARELYRAVIEAAGAAIFIVDESGHLVTTNATGRELFGIGADDHPPLRELLLRGHIRTIDGKPVEHGHGPTSRALKGETIRGEYAFSHAGTGADTTVRLIAMPLRGPDARVRGAIVTMHDISEITRTEREKEKFLSLVTHELKTPLTPLKSVAQLIRLRLRRSREGGATLDLDVLERNLLAIERQVDRMDRLVTDLLEVSRIGRGRFELAPRAFDLGATVRDLVQRWTALTDDEGRHRFELDAPGSVPITADPDRIEQVVANLVGNAVKYSPRGGTVWVRLSATDRDASVTVRDEGIGIPGDEIGRLGHAPYVRGRHANGFAGVGVGLYLSRLIAEGHGGRLELESEGEEKGTTARLTLPR